MLAQTCSIEKPIGYKKMLGVFYSKFFWLILIVKFGFTIFAFFVYSKFTPFTDASYYLSSRADWNSIIAPKRTSYVHFVYYVLKKILDSDLAVHLFVSFTLAYILWYVFRKNYYFLNKPLFYSSLFLPHFMIWSGMVGKEPLAIAGFLLLIRACVDCAVGNSIKVLPLLIGLLLSLFVRPHYFLAYGYLFLITLFLTKFRFKVFYIPKNSLWFLFFCMIGVVVFLGFCWDHLAPSLLHYMKITKYNYFLNQSAASRANRLDIMWAEPRDFIINLWWGLPISIIGPTLQEVLARPVIFPALLEGCFSLFLFIYILWHTMKCAFNNPKYNAVIILGLIPAILMGLLLNYPFGLFNPGSAIRYKQSLVPLLYFYPMLLMSELKMIKFLER